MGLNSGNVFVDMDLRLPDLRAFGLLCQLDSGSGITKAKSRLLDIAPHHCFMLKRLFQKGYIDAQGGYFASKVLVNAEARLISGFGQGMGLDDTMNVFLDGELRRSQLRAFGILSKLDAGDGVRDLRQKYHGICGLYLPTRTLREKGYILRSKGRFFVTPGARKGSGLALGVGESGFEIAEEVVYK